MKLTFNFYLDKIMNPGTLFYASKHACNLFLIEIRLRNYRRRIDKDILFFKILKEQPNFECIVSYCLQEGSRHQFGCPVRGLPVRCPGVEVLRCPSLRAWLGIMISIFTPSPACSRAYRAATCQSILATVRVA